VANRTSARSYLYVPADQRDRLATAAGRGADALIVDLEDGVAVAAKAVARENAAAWLSDRRDEPPAWVRVNVDSLEEDLSALVGTGMAGVVLPKAEPATVTRLDRLLTQLERRRSVPEPLAVIGLIETARGLMSAAEVASSPRVCHLGIGEADLMAELRMRPGPGREEMTGLRLAIVVASAAAGIGAPIAPTSTDFRDLDGLADSTRMLLRLGFRARTAIHPAQLAVINAVFTPSPEEVEQARRIVDGYEAAAGRGGGVLTDDAGRMVDIAVVRSALEVLDRAPASGPPG
jgi:citrate lyase subunit beta / citryl-CoA lyase